MTDLLIPPASLARLAGRMDFPETHASGDHGPAPQERGPRRHMNRTGGAQGCRTRKPGRKTVALGEED